MRRFPPTIESLVVTLAIISRNVASIEDAELLVISAITPSMTDLSDAKEVSFIPLTVKLADITSGASGKSYG